VVVAGAFAVGLSGREETPPATPAAGSSPKFHDGLWLTYPGGWRQVATPEAARLLGLRSPLAMAPAGAPRGDALVAGRTRDPAPTAPLAPALLAAAAGTPRAEVITFPPDRRMRALRYRNVALPDQNAELDVYVLGGSLTLACVRGAEPVPALTTGCERAAADTARSADVGSVALGPSAAYAERLEGALTSLERRRRAHRAAFARADTAIGQTANAARLRDAYADAASAVADAGPPGHVRRANARIAAALRRAAAAHRALGVATDVRSGPLYVAARRRVIDAERGVTRALAELGTLGYPAAPRGTDR
jgi:hypothetical protein